MPRDIATAGKDKKERLDTTLDKAVKLLGLAEDILDQAHKSRKEAEAKPAKKNWLGLNK